MITGRVVLLPLISSFFGVSNVFMNDVSGGGLNNEGMQIVVTNRALAASQTLYNGRLFPLLLEFPLLDSHFFGFFWFFVFSVFSGFLSSFLALCRRSMG